ncbi:hypothetical protein CO705_17895 [Ralstonia pickettii]|nr:hypothetical protein CO705_17895 [Ralstonia pickettii]
MPLQDGSRNRRDPGAPAVRWPRRSSRAVQRLLGCGPGLGARRLSFLYFSSIVSAALAQIVCAAVGLQPAGPVIGASGGLFGLLLAYAVLFPNRRVVPLFPPIPMPAWLFATVYGGVEFVFGVSGIESGVAHFAHLGGMAGSGLLLWAWLRAAPRESSS